MLLLIILLFVVQYCYLFIIICVQYCYVDAAKLTSTIYRTDVMESDGSFVTMMSWIRVIFHRSMVVQLTYMA